LQRAPSDSKTYEWQVAQACLPVIELGQEWTIQLGYQSNSDDLCLEQQYQ
jgi:hypothetical protein